MKTVSLTKIVVCSLALSSQHVLGATNLVLNPGFESGNTGFVTSYVYTPGASPSSSLNLRQYVIGTDPANHHSAGESYGDHTTGSGNMMIINGSNNINDVVWQSSQTIPIAGNTDYFFEAWASNWTNVPNFGSILTFQVRGSTGVWETLGTTSFDGAVFGVWTPVSEVWNSGLSTTAELRILNAQGNAGGNDFALDDIYFGAESSIPEPASAVLVAGFGIGLALRRRSR